jgi:hypothetical protein
MVRDKRQSMFIPPMSTPANIRIFITDNSAGRRWQFSHPNEIGQQQGWSTHLNGARQIAAMN